mmetsp:Transcript_91363/g.126862  ORF Transcript_91363/g.126862 Transcript_91363/m.126862 type:complete len:242 (-) Transcript_91363:108-833(-)
MVKFQSALVILLGAMNVAASSNIRSEDDPTASNRNKHMVVLETFDNPAHIWEEQNDPVMGGRSTGTFTIENGVGKFEGEVVDVPFLQAPGFLQARSAGGPSGEEFPDISRCSALQIVAKSNTPYQGYRVSFGKAHAPGGKLFAYGYKASFSLEGQRKKDKDGFALVTIPFNDFTDFWDDATGDPIKTCQEDPLYCPDMKTLKNVQRLTLWAEGIAGKVSLEVKSFQAVGCKADSSVDEALV